MAKQCIVEFYFRKEDLLKLLNTHTSAKGVIFSQEIVQKKQANGAPFNVVHIKARVDKKAKAPVKSGKLKFGAAAPDDGSIDGCPYPPGCPPPDNN